MSRRLREVSSEGEAEIPPQKKPAPTGADDAAAAAVIAGEPPEIVPLKVCGRQPKNPRLANAVTEAGEAVLARIPSRVKPWLVVGMVFSARVETATLYVMVPPFPRAKGRF